jgi:CHAT domain-containing protein
MGSVRWGNWALKRESWSEAIEAFTYGRQIIEQLLKVQLLRQNKHTWIEEAFGLFSGLAYALARGGRLKETVVALEHGRARLLSESLQFGRRDLEHLPLLGYEELYFRFSELKDKYSAISQADEDDSNIITEQTNHLAGIFAELQKIIASIQCVPGYEDFFVLPDLRQIQSFAAEMPIVYLVTTEAGALGVVVTQESIREVWSDLTNSNVIEWLNQQNEDPVSEGYIAGQFGNTALLNSSLENILPKLGQGFIEKIAAEIRSMGLKEFTLIPSGWLGLFPLHAATYTYKGQVICLLDEFIVHYSPSAQALRAARAFLSSKDESRKELAGVGNPLPNPRPLMYGQAELEEIEVMFNGNSKTVYREKATKEDFLKMLPSATHVHFSCHGRFNSGIPLYSSLLLAKHDVLTLDEILTQFVFTNTRLVTLSACQTAITDFKKLIDESIGFPAGFMEAGIPGVIGTLWSIDDLSTAFLMLRFYELHIKDGRSPAESLRSAQLWLRDLTNDEMSDFLKNYYLDDQPSEGRTMFGIARNEFRKYVTPLGNLKPFEKPVYWAAFVFYGL